MQLPAHAPDTPFIRQLRLVARACPHCAPDVCLASAVSEVAALLEQGQLNRKIGETMMNSESSRSHSVFTAVLECKTTDESGITHVLSSRLNLVDLAGASMHTVLPCKLAPPYRPLHCVSAATLACMNDIAAVYSNFCNALAGTQVF